MEPSISLHSGTMRQRNLCAELSKAGAKLVLIPRWDSLQNHRDWLRDVAEVVAAGLDRDVALRGMTLEPAGLIGMQERLGSLETGKDANLIFLNGDPLETGTRIQAVMLEGEIVYGEVN
jgi:imidazolonepropionase-like amidohydrolase